MDLILAIIAVVLDILSVAGMQLNASGKLKQSYILWIIANTGWILYDLYGGDPVQSILFIIYTIQAIYALSRGSKNETAN
jgi:hypothetical protein